jgi:hypothetical protein
VDGSIGSWSDFYNTVDRHINDIFAWLGWHYKYTRADSLANAHFVATTWTLDEPILSHAILVLLLVVVAFLWIDHGGCGRDHDVIAVERQNN